MLVTNPKNFKTITLCSSSITISELLSHENIRREEIDLPGTRCFLLHNLLNKDECKVTSNSSIHFTSFFFNCNISSSITFPSLSRHNLCKQFKENYHNNDRVLVLSESQASILWERIEPCEEVDVLRLSLFLSLSRVLDILRVRPMCFGNGGTWKSIKLNECFKFGKYYSSGHFREAYV